MTNKHNISRTSLPAGQNKLFCFGLGYTARNWIERLIVEGWSVAGTVRDPDAEAPYLVELADKGVAVHRFSRDNPLPDPAATFHGVSHILCSVPPEETKEDAHNGGPSGDPVLDCHGEDIARITGLEWLGYLSTTGVYGDCQGGWVDETSPLRPSSPRSARRVRAEEGWMALYRDHNVPVHLFRLSGIYGPGSSQIESLRKGNARRIVKPGQVFCRIHVDDIATTLSHSAAQPDPGAVYNLADDEPAAPQDVVAFAADLINMETPPEIAIEDAGLSPMAASFYADCRRVRNDLIKQELGVSLAFPTYREGLRALAKSGSDIKGE